MFRCEECKELCGRLLVILQASNILYDFGSQKYFIIKYT